MRKFSQYLKEVDHNDLRSIGKSLNKFNKGNTNFNDIFGDKKRIAISIQKPDPDLQKFMNDLQSLNLSIPKSDLKKGYVTTKIKTQQGEQTRQLKIANFLNNIKKTSNHKDKIDDMLKNWSIVKDKLGKMDDDDYSVIISRYPLDILRMSDHIDDNGNEIQSCHSPSGGWFNCAIKESHVGGAVAYAVKTSDLEKINLQDKEIFRDKDRGVKGIFPLERVRLRRFHNPDKDLDLLIPELRTYPLSSGRTSRLIPGFLSAVNEWAKETQKNTIDKINPEDDFENFNLRGGSYQDNSSGELWSHFFGVSIEGEKDSVDQKDKDHIKADVWEHQANMMVRGHNFRHVNVDFDVHESRERGSWGTWKASLNYEFDGDKFIKTPTEDVFNNSDYHSLFYYIKYVVAELHVIEPQQLDITNYISFDLILTDGEGNLNDFEHYLDHMDRIDKNNQVIEDRILFWFTYNNYIKNPAKDLMANQSFKHFELYHSYNDHKKPYFIRSSNFDIGTLRDASANFFKFFSANGEGGYRCVNCKMNIPNLVEVIFLSTINFANLSWQKSDKEILACFTAPLTPESIEQVKQVDDDFENYVEHVQQWWAKNKSNHL